MLRKDLGEIRKNYQRSSLLETDVPENPMELFHHWLDQAIEIKCSEPTAMILSTVSPDLHPSSRAVLLKNITETGFVFFTNYESRKAKDLEATPYASLNFFWAELERQIRIEGRVEKTNEKDSDEYFLSRPPESRLGAWASPQSRVIRDREELEALMQKSLDLISENVSKRPPFWGGYCLTPDRIEFWQGRPNRLHDRIQYTKTDNTWKIERLAP